MIRRTLFSLWVGAVTIAAAAPAPALTLAPAGTSSGDGAPGDFYGWAIDQTEQLNMRQFERFRDLIYVKSGIRINDNKLSLLSSRIRRRLKVSVDNIAPPAGLSGRRGESR